ncbi:unnamed protein product [Microthlaspi erraticum]|uniref:Aspergillus nuclease S1 n=1 Tax=Microthlaspi erraticum TaxID=1685480 RepID=A0A6D2IRP3_9BRAS|nr:unnamed protein product [Microthlaspi erraticum]
MSCPKREIACPDEYVGLNRMIADKFAYRSATQGYEYLRTRLPFVYNRLAEGGVHLAATLNRIFDAKPKLASA